MNQEIRAESISAKEGDHVTYLLWGRQVNPEVEKSFHCTSVRLETAVAVQNQSQWHVSIDPRFHDLTLHWLRVVREGKATDCLQRERMRLIQRETQLERHVLDGSWTLLVVLDDVRPGDIIEAGYTYQHRHPIRKGGCEEFYFVPPQVVIGRFYLSVLFQPSHRILAWKASADAPPVEMATLADGWARWSWQGSQPTTREFEPNPPSWFLDYIWVQLSDLGSWAELARLVSSAWDKHALSAEVAELPYPKPAVVDRAAVVALIRRVQDEFRYLSVDLETGGWIPSDPGAVARRRYGDCKDLAWLVATVLHGWGVKVRPILVGTGLCKSIGSMLPTLRLFNHAVLEIEVEGEARWFDLTLRFQGGTYKEMPVNYYGVGLPIHAEAEGLIAQPGTRTPSRYLLRETLLVDTRKSKPSLVERRTRVEGWQADIMRASRFSMGAEDFNKERLEEAKRRFGKARPSGRSHWRDNRDQNVCELVEEFEIDDAVYVGSEDKRSMLDMPVNFIVQSFGIPSDKTRRAPWDMPFPFEMRHKMTVLHDTMGKDIGARRSWSGPEVTALLEEEYGKGEWSKTAHFIVNQDDIPPDRIAAYRAELEKFALATSWRLHLPWDKARPERVWKMGELPDPLGAQASYVSAANSADFLPAAEVEAQASKKKSWEGTLIDSGKRDTNWWLIGWPIVIGLSAIARSCSGNQ